MVRRRKGVHTGVEGERGPAVTTRSLAGLSIFLRRMESLTRLALTQYKPTQLESRIRARMEKDGAADLDDYYFLLLKDAAKRAEFLRTVIITVTEFFRDSELFQELEERYLPELAESGHTLRVWSAGCSDGAEIYSLAMLLDERDWLKRSRLLATDIDDETVELGRKGVYTAAALKAVAPGRLQRYFTAVTGARYHVVPRLMHAVEFRRHDLLKDPFSDGWSLILCRNVAIYLQRPAQERLFQQLAAALRPGGILLLGNAEDIIDYRELGLVRLASHFYRSGSAQPSVVE